MSRPTQQLMVLDSNGKPVDEEVFAHQETAWLHLQALQSRATGTLHIGPAPEIEAA